MTGINKRSFIEANLKNSHKKLFKILCIFVFAFMAFFLSLMSGCSISRQKTVNPGTPSPGMTVDSPKTDKTTNPTKSSLSPFPTPNNEIDVSKKFKTKSDLFSYYQDLGSECHRTGEEEMAIEYFTKAIEADPDNYEGYDLRSMAYYEMGEHKKGIRDCNKAISIARKKGLFEKVCPEQTLVRRGAHYMNLKKYKEAIKDFSIVIKYRPNFAFAYYDRGRCYLRKGDYESARKDLLKAIKLGKKNKFTDNCKKYLKEMEKIKKGKL
ncbi:MAG: tetratricopeptide repeat protein [Candidatus Eremiobacteraeota bacterium]|nr:tetratricopeptide repeat protein [Candidatus Eremiobacteraeota bacterium]